MAAFLSAFCPIDGLLLGSKTITTPQKNDIGDRIVRDHGSWDLAGSLACTNGHTWSASGKIEVRWDPADSNTL